MTSRTLLNFNVTWVCFSVCIMLWYPRTVLSLEQGLIILLNNAAVAKNTIWPIQLLMMFPPVCISRLLCVCCSRAAACERSVEQRCSPVREIRANACWWRHRTFTVWTINHIVCFTASAAAFSMSYTDAFHFCLLLVIDCYLYCQIKWNHLFAQQLRDQHLLTIYKTDKPDSKAPNKKHRQLLSNLHKIESTLEITIH